MDSTSNDPKNDWQVCEERENCKSEERKHFYQFSHPHLADIYKKGRDTETKEYIIPDELSQHKEIFLSQLELIEKLRLSFINLKVSNISSKENESEYVKNALDCLKELREITIYAKSPGKMDLVPIQKEPGRMLEKLKRAWPYNIFLTAITDSELTHDEPLTVTFQEILDQSLGEIESTVQINFMVDFNWLILHYTLAGIMDKPLLILYGSDYAADHTRIKERPQMTIFKVKMPSDWGIPHAKVTILGYKDGSMRLVISTANLILDDWRNRTQGLWISPKLKRLPSNATMREGESKTNFRSDFISFLHKYECPHLKPWIERIRQTDFSDINVFLIASVPGIDTDGWRGFSYGHERLGAILQKHCPPIDESIPVVCQSSGVGTFGPNIGSWIEHDFLNSACKDTQHKKVNKFSPLNFIFPSFENVCNGHNGILESGWLPYEKSVNDKQLWLRNYLYQWICESRHRTRAIPHIKSYARFNFEEKCVFWFLLTSSNFSKSAWGNFNQKTKNYSNLRISNYEAGVLFLPNYVTGEQTFPLGNSRNGVPTFPLPYDVPLTPYKPDDKIYTAEDAVDYIKANFCDSEEDEEEDEALASKFSQL